MQPATGIGRPTKLFLSTFGVPSAIGRGRIACTLNLARRKPPQTTYMNDRNQARCRAFSQSCKAVPEPQAYSKTAGGEPKQKKKGVKTASRLHSCLVGWFLSACVYTCGS